MTEGYQPKDAGPIGKPPRGGSAVALPPGKIVHGCCGADAPGPHAPHCGKPAPVVTQAKYFHHRYCIVDGQHAFETIGFQTHAELIQYLIAHEEDVRKVNALLSLVESTPKYCGSCGSPLFFPAPSTDAPTIREASE